MRDEAGSAVIAAVLLLGMALVFLVETVNLGAWVLERDIAHSAADQSVRAGARADVEPVSSCHDRGAQVLGNLLAGPAGAGAVLECSADADAVHAYVHLPLRSWIPGLPDASTEVRAVARREREP